MPTTEGRANTGWLILFNLEETREIAGSVETYTAPLAAAAALAPEPAISKVIAAGGGALVVASRVATKKHKALGIYFNGPLFYYNRNFRRLTLRDAPKYLYTRFTSLVVPFFYNPDDPESLASWRRSVGL